VAATDSDNLNFAVATVAKKVFQVPNVLVCISDPDKEYAYQRMGAHTICPAVLGAVKICDEILKEGEKTYGNITANACAGPRVGAGIQKAQTRAQVAV
jgi:trk system potassium uptake protein TrkA